MNKTAWIVVSLLVVVLIIVSVIAYLNRKKKHEFAERLNTMYVKGTDTNGNEVSVSPFFASTQ